MSEGIKIKKTHIKYTVKVTKTVHTFRHNLKKHLKHLNKYHVKIECSVHSIVCQTAVLIGVSYTLMSYFEPIAMNKLYFNDDRVYSTKLSE